jgi:hypothetical protein
MKLKKVVLAKQWLMATTAMAAACVPVAGGVMNSPKAFAQEIAASPPAFDEVTIGLSEATSDPSVHSRFSNTRDGNFSAMTATINDLIWFAYEVDSTRVAGGPDWIRSVRYEIRANAKPKLKSDGTQEPVPFKLMSRSLLMDRFRLRFHTDHCESRNNAH